MHYENQIQCGKQASSISVSENKCWEGRETSSFKVICKLAFVDVLE